MNDDTQKRMMVTLPQWVISRVRTFQAQRGYPSEAQAIRKLIETGLGAFDSREDLSDQCQAATSTNNNIADLLGGLLDGHPLVRSIDLNSEYLTVNLHDGEHLQFHRRSSTWTQSWLPF